jgi:hypothetical protein
MVSTSISSSSNGASGLEVNATTSSSTKRNASEEVHSQTAPKLHQGWVAPVPMVMGADDLEAMRSGLLNRIPGDYVVPMTVFKPCPLFCCAITFTFKQENNGYSAVAENKFWCCCCVRTECLDALSKYTVDSQGTSFDQTHTLQYVHSKQAGTVAKLNQYTIPGVLTSFDRDALLATYSFTGKSHMGRMEGTITVNGKDGTIVTKHGGAKWRGMRLRANLVRKSWQTVV